MSEEAGREGVVLDLRGLKCPLPVLHTRKVFARVPAGTLVTVTCTDPMAAIDIPHLAHETGAVLRAKDMTDGVLTFRLLAPGPPR